MENCLVNMLQNLRLAREPKMIVMLCLTSELNTDRHPLDVSSTSVVCQVKDWS